MPKVKPKNKERMAIRKKGQKRSPIKKIDYDGNTFKSGLEVYCYKKLKEENEMI